MTLEEWLKGGSTIIDLSVAVGLRNFIGENNCCGEGCVRDYWYDDKDMWAIDVLEDGTCITSCYAE